MIACVCVCVCVCVCIHAQDTCCGWMTVDGVSPLMSVASAQTLAAIDRWKSPAEGRGGEGRGGEGRGSSIECPCVLFSSITPASIYTQYNSTKLYTASMWSDLPSWYVH